MEFISFPGVTACSLEELRFKSCHQELSWKPFRCLAVSLLILSVEQCSAEALGEGVLLKKGGLHCEPCSTACQAQLHGTGRLTACVPLLHVISTRECVQIEIKSG